MVDHLVGGNAALEIIQPHVMLLGLVAREDDDLARRPHLARQQAAHETWPSDPVPPVMSIRLFASVAFTSAI